MYISPSNSRVTEWKPAMLWYIPRLMSTNFSFPAANFSFSSASLAKDFTTRMPDRLSSTCAFSSPRWKRESLKLLRILREKWFEQNTISGSAANTMTVSATFVWQRIANAATILISAMNISSGSGARTQ